MSWRQFARLTLVLVALTVLRFLSGELAEWVALLGLLLIGYFAIRVARRRWRHRTEMLRSASDEEAETALARLPADERAAMRLALGRVANPELLAAADVHEFRYPRTPALLREGTFWLSAAIASVAYLKLLAGWDREERWYALALGLGFTASVGYQRVAWDRELTVIRVSPAGIEHRASDGGVVAMPWCEIAGIRDRRLLMHAELRGTRGRRIRVGYTLIGFARLMELTLAYIAESREAAAGDRAR